MTLLQGAAPRAVCERCRRPESVCYCRHIAPLETRTRVVLLQHPRERDVPIGTARIANLCLPNSELHVGVHWGNSPALKRALSDPSRPAALLYPGPGAIDVVQSPPSTAVTLVVVDGTWSQTKKVVRENPHLRALPRYAFTPPTASEYRIRKEPDETYVSTIEALAHVLGALESDPERCKALLLPFRAMVDAQIAYATTLRQGRRRKARPAKAPPSPWPSWLDGRANDLVCVVGEANAWPYLSRERETEYPDELVHWVACRVMSGEVFEARIAPRNPLSQRTPENLELTRECLLSGMSLPMFFEQWNAFVRETDILCSWGPYAPTLLASVGGYAPEAQVDLRQRIRNVTRDKVGTVEDYASRLGCLVPSQVGLGRAGRRLARLGSITRALVGLSQH